MIEKSLIWAMRTFLPHPIGHVHKLPLAQTLSKPCHPWRIHITLGQVRETSVLLLVCERSALDRAIVVGGK